MTTLPLRRARRWPAAALFALAGAAVAAPPTNEQIDAALAAYRTIAAGEHPRDDARIGDLFRRVSIEEMSAAQFERLGIVLDVAPLEMRARFRDRLRQIARTDTSADGAAAAAHLVRLIDLPSDDAPPDAAENFERDRADALIAAADHPGFAEAVKAGRGTIVYYYMFFYAANEHVRTNRLAARLAAHVNDQWPPAALDDLLAFTEGVIAPDSGLERAAVDRVRAVATRLAQAEIARPGTDEERRTGLLDAVGAINSAAARGELVGGPAPALDFLWCNARPPAASLADFKGRVVVLDFWATWCGPCVAAFPHMRELRERFRHAPVEIVGVTSLQGWILDPRAKDPAARRVRGLSPDDELKRLAAWAADMEMTWTVAVSRQPVFNADYGVRGLPTVVIVDARGVVRHAGLSPADGTLAARVEALLAEQSSPAPTTGAK